MLHSEWISAAEKKSQRTLVLLHGLGDSIAGWRWISPALDLPWLNFLLINAPDNYYGGFSWFDYPDNMAPGILRSRKLLFGLLDDLLAKKIPPEQIILGGFSQGGLMSVDVGLRYPHRLGGIIDISGWVYEVEKLLTELSPVAREQRLLITHGPLDQVIPFAPVKRQAQTLQRAGLKVEWREFPKGHTVYGEEEIAVIRQFISSALNDATHQV